MTAARGPAFATAVRVVDRVLGDAAGQRTLAHPAVAAGLGEGLVRRCRGSTPRRPSPCSRADVALLARIEADDDHAAVAADDLHIGARRTGDLAALAGLHLDVVDDRADRHLADFHRVARLHVDLLAGDDLVARREALRRDDVGLLAVLVLDERDERRAVRDRTRAARRSPATSHLRRLKSMKRYFCLWPPAMPREVTWPLLLRPPVLRLPSVSALTGLPFHSDDLSTRIRPRRAGLVGL